MSAEDDYNLETHYINQRGERGKRSGYNQSEVAERRGEVRRYLNEGYTQKDICAFLPDVSQATISLDMKAIREEDRQQLAYEHMEIPRYYRMVIENYLNIHQDLVARIRLTKSARDAAVLISERIKVLDKLLLTASSSDVILAGVENAERIIKEAQQSKVEALQRLSEIREEVEERKEDSTTTTTTAMITAARPAASQSSYDSNSDTNDISSSSSSDSTAVALFTTATGNSEVEGSEKEGDNSSSLTGTGNGTVVEEDMAYGGGGGGSSAPHGPHGAVGSDSDIESFKRIVEQIKNKNENESNENELVAPTTEQDNASSTTTSEKGDPTNNE